MRKQITVLFTLLLISVCSLAQEEGIVQYEEIQKNIEDVNSPFYYPSLVERYQKSDETLTTEDYRYLYYGFTFQPEYRPYERNPLDLKITELLSGATTEDDFKQLKQFTEEFLEQDPFSLKLLNYLEHFNYNIQDVDSTENENLKKKYNAIIKAILSTGDGKAIETGYTVNQPSDEYMVMRYLGLNPTNSIIETAYDKYDLQPNDKGLNAIFFDVYRMAKVGTEQLGVKTVEVEADSGQSVQISENGLVIGSEDELLEFIPPGANVLYKNKADIDGDGDIDWVLVTGEGLEAKTSNFAGGYPKYRKFFILTRNENKVVEKTFESEKVIPCIDCGGTGEDPLVDIELEEEVIRIFSKGGDLYKWERVSEFHLFENEWYLLKEEFSSYRRGKEDQKQTDLETPEDFGEVTIKNYNYYDMLQD